MCSQPPPIWSSETFYTKNCVFGFNILWWIFLSWAAFKYLEAFCSNKSPSSHMQHVRKHFLLFLGVWSICSFYLMPLVLVLWAMVNSYSLIAFSIAVRIDNFFISALSCLISRPKSLKPLNHGLKPFSHVLAPKAIQFRSVCYQFGILQIKQHIDL